MESLMARFQFLALALVSLFAAEPKKQEPKDLPKVSSVLPFGIAPGVATRLTIRGSRLDTATEVRCQEPKAKVKLLKKSKAGNDSQVEAEVTLPKDYPNRTVTISVLTRAGESPYHLLLVDRNPVVAEKEPNNSFRQAQTIQVPQSVQGVIGAAKDVDLFRFEGKSGSKLTIEVLASRYGSPLDSLLTLYDRDGRILASCDDIAGRSDSRLDVTLPRDGAYFVGVIDANDQGGSTHFYRLQVAPTKP
jgi:hypothetical protein